MDISQMLTLIGSFLGINVALFGALATLVYWMVNRIDNDVKGIYNRLDKIEIRLDGHSMRIDQLHKIFVDLLKEREKIIKMNQSWISVKDQEPPKDGTPFLCYDPNQIDNFPLACIYVVHFQEDTEYINGCFVETGGECYFTWEPTHWMPLPNPPEKE